MDLRYIWLWSISIYQIVSAATIQQKMQSQQHFFTSFQNTCNDNVKLAFDQAIEIYEQKLHLHESVRIHVKCQPIPGSTLGITTAPTHTDPTENKDKVRKACTQALLKQKLAGNANGAKLRYNSTHTLLQHLEGTPDMFITIRTDANPNHSTGWFTPTTDTTAIGRNQLDMVATALHEISHGLGFSSTSANGGHFHADAVGNHPSDWPIPADFGVYDINNPMYIQGRLPYFARTYDHYLTPKGETVPYLVNPIYLRFVDSIPTVSTLVVDWLDRLERTDYEAYIYARLLQNSFMGIGDLYFKSNLLEPRCHTPIFVSSNPSQIDLSHLQQSEPDASNFGWMAPSLPRGISLRDYKASGKHVIPPQVLDILDTLGWNVPYNANDAAFPVDFAKAAAQKKMIWQILAGLIIVATLMLIIGIYRWRSKRKSDLRRKEQTVIALSQPTLTPTCPSISSGLRTLPPYQTQPGTQFNTADTRRTRPPVYRAPPPPPRAPVLIRHQHSHVRGANIPASPITDLDTGANPAFIQARCAIAAPALPDRKPKQLKRLRR